MADNATAHARHRQLDASPAIPIMTVALVMTHVAAVVVGAAFLQRPIPMTWTLGVIGVVVGAVGVLLLPHVAVLRRDAAGRVALAEQIDEAREAATLEINGVGESMAWHMAQLGGQIGAISTAFDAGRQTGWHEAQPMPDAAPDAETP